jgi:Holliday junction resolvase RusA-like endonuclease
MARKLGAAVQTFIPIMPRGMTHNDLEAYVYHKDGHAMAAIRKGDKLRAAEMALIPYIERAAPKRPLTGRIRQRVKYCFATKGKHRQGEPMDRPPDIDNMTKTLNDLCERFGYIANDCRVVDFSAIKVYADPAGIFVRFEEIV